MWSTDLETRLNDRQYTNWLKAGRCLLILKNGLHPFAERHSRAFHADLLNQNPLLRSQCQLSCRPRENKLFSACRVCSQWQKVILRHHRQPNATINWGNCSPPEWRTDHWEVAKAFMPRGQAKVKRADKCDAPALLNLINNCTYFSSADPNLVREVIQYRNELMHSCEYHVTDEWMGRFWTTVKHFVHLFSHVPEMATVGKEIDRMVAIDLSIYVSGVDQMDSGGLEGGSTNHSAIQQDTGADLVSQWETLLLQEMLQELCHAAAAEDDDDDALTEDSEQLKSLNGFLLANKDLHERFSAELQAISSLKAKAKGGGGE